MRPSGAGPHAGVSGGARRPQAPRLLLLLWLRAAPARGFSRAAAGLRRPASGERVRSRDGPGVPVTLSQSRGELV